MFLKIQYPLPITELITGNDRLDGGLTPTEIVALQNGWRLIKRSLIYHAAKIATNENYLLLETFRDEETKKFHLHHLHRHTLEIMHFYGRLIESGLSDVAFMNVLLGEIVNQYKKYGITPDHITSITNYIKQYVLEFLNKINTATFESALEKLSELINEEQRAMKL